MRAVVGLLAVGFANNLYVRPALAADAHPYAKEVSKVLCKWIELRHLPAGVHIPHVCFAPDDVSTEDAYQEIVNLWTEWDASDAAGGKEAHNSWGQELQTHWNEITAKVAVGPSAPALASAPAPAQVADDNDSDYSCRAAQNMCRDGMSMCAEYRQDFIRAGRVCPGVTDIAIPTSVQQPYDAEAALQQAIAVCQEVMRQRPMQDNQQQGGGAIGVFASVMRQRNNRDAAVNLCLSDPQAHLKPLPWEQAVQQPAPSKPTVCFYQAMPSGQATLMCP